MGITWSICLPLPRGLRLALGWHSGGKAARPFQLLCLAEAFSTAVALEPSLVFQAAGQSASCWEPGNLHVRDHVPLRQLSGRLYCAYLLSFSEVSQPVIKVFKNKTGEEHQRAASLYPPQYVEELSTQLKRHLQLPGFPSEVSCPKCQLEPA